MNIALFGETMKRASKRKESKITFKTHHNHHLPFKEEMKEIRGGITRFLPTRLLPRAKEKRERS